MLSLDQAGVLERVKALVPAERAAEVLAAYKRLYPGLQPSDWLFRLATARKAEQHGAPAFLYSFNCR